MTDERHERDEPADRPTEDAVETAPRADETTPARERAGFPWGLIAFVILSVLLAVFAVQNVQDVELQFLAWSGEFPLILIIVGVFAMAIVLDEILGAILRRRRRIRQAEKRELADYRKRG